MEFVTAAEILAAKELPWEAVFIPALKKHVVVVGMSGRGRDTFEASLVVGKGKARNVKTDNIRAKLAARCLYTAPPGQGGVRMFTDDQADQLGDVRADVLSPAFDAAQKLSGVTDADLDELGKDSGTTTSDTSSSSSLSN
jgi:hypothetical protein